MKIEKISQKDFKNGKKKKGRKLENQPKRFNIPIKGITEKEVM